MAKSESETTDGPRTFNVCDIEGEPEIEFRDGDEILLDFSEYDAFDFIHRCCDCGLEHCVAVRRPRTRKRNQVRLKLTRRGREEE